MKTTLKTTTRTASENRLNKLVAEKKVRTKSHAYQNALALISGLDKVHTVILDKYKYSYRSYTRDTTDLLDRLGLSWEKGNNAPRGGASGEYIKLTTKVIAK